MLSIYFIDCRVGIHPNIVNISVFNALSIGSGFVVAVFLCIKREGIYFYKKYDFQFCILNVALVGKKTINKQYNGASTIQSGLHN